MQSLSKWRAPDAAIVQIETGVAGQSTDIVLESEARHQDRENALGTEPVRGLERW